MKNQTSLENLRKQIASLEKKRKEKETRAELEMKLRRLKHPGVYKFARGAARVGKAIGRGSIAVGKKIQAAPAPPKVKKKKMKQRLPRAYRPAPVQAPANGYDEMPMIRGDRDGDMMDFINTV